MRPISKYYLVPIAKLGFFKKSFMALHAKLYLDGDIFFLVLRSKIRKKMSPSKESPAAAGGEIPFIQHCQKTSAAKPQKSFRI